MKKKKKLILGVLTGVLIGMVIGVTYAMFSYTATSNNQELITGDIYMHYKESNTLRLKNTLPSTTYDPNTYFEFTIDGKNTNTLYDIYYDINLLRGDVPTGKLEANRIQDRFLKFRLTEFVNNVETEIFTNKSYSDLSSGKRVHVATISKNTMNEVVHRYRLYMWISNDVVIGNTGNSGIDYDMTTWNNLFASIKVSATGDFEEKVIYTDESCFTTTVSNNEVTITGYDVSCGNDVIIPNTINGNIVTTIGNEAFASKQLASVKIPDSVTSIGVYAFVQNQITSLSIPDNVTTIASGAFLNNPLTSIVIPDSVTTIGMSAFANNQLTSVTIGSGVVTLENGAFFNNLLTHIEINASNLTLNSGVFGQNSLEKTVKVNCATIGDSALMAFNITELELGDDVTTISENAFSGNKLTTVEIPDSVETIGVYSFRGNQLTSVTIGNRITTIGPCAFENNPNLTSMIIDKSCNDIKNNLKFNNTNYYPWLSAQSPYTASGVTIYGSNNEVCDEF